MEIYCNLENKQIELKVCATITVNVKVENKISKKRLEEIKRCLFVAYTKSFDLGKKQIKDIVIKHEFSADGKEANILATMFLPNTERNRKLIDLIINNNNLGGRNAYRKNNAERT